MFEKYSPNGFNVHRYENENENVNEFDLTIHGNAMFQNKNDDYPDYNEKDRYERRSGQNVQINHVDVESQKKLNELKNNNPGVVINKKDDDVMDPNSFFNNTSQVYLLYNLGENLKK